MDTNNVFEEEDGIVDVSYSEEIPKYILKEGEKLWSCSASSIPERNRGQSWDTKMQRGSTSSRLTGSDDVVNTRYRYNHNTNPNVKQLFATDTHAHRYG